MHNEGKRRGVLIYKAPQNIKASEIICFNVCEAYNPRHFVPSDIVNC